MQTKAPMGSDRRIIRSDKLPSVSTMSWGIEANGVIYLSGVVAMSPDGSVIGPDDAPRQATACLDLIEALLNDAGTDLNAVLRATCYATSREAGRAYIAERSKRMLNVPAATTVIVDSLLSPGVVLEIEVIALGAPR